MNYHENEIALKMELKIKSLLHLIMSSMLNNMIKEIVVHIS